jgi:hypothetical protein
LLQVIDLHCCMSKLAFHMSRFLYSLRFCFNEQENQNGHCAILELQGHEKKRKKTKPGEEDTGVLCPAFRPSTLTTLWFYVKNSNRSNTLMMP